MGIYPALQIQPPDVIDPMLKAAQIGQTQQQTQNLALDNQQKALNLDIYRNAAPTTISGMLGQGSGAGGAATSGNPDPRLALVNPGAYSALVNGQRTVTATQQDRAALASIRNQQALTGVSNQDDWQAAVTQQYKQGDLSDLQYARYIGTPFSPEMKAQLMSNFVGTNKAFANIGYNLDTGKKTVQQPDGSVTQTYIPGAPQTQAAFDAAKPREISPGGSLYLPQGSQQPAAANTPSNASSSGTPSAAMPLSDFSAKVVQNESGGNPTAANGNSTSSGAAGFTDGTWLQTLKQQRPDIAQGKSDQQLLAMKTNPDLATQMAGAYAQQNAPALTKAGLPVTAATLALAHQFGPQGAQAIAQAGPFTPASKVLSPQALQANPQLAQMTTGDILEQTTKRYGAMPVDISTAPNGASSTGAPSFGTLKTAPGPNGGTVISNPNSPMQISVNTGGLPKEAETIGEGTGKMYNDLRNTYLQLPSQMNNIGNAMDALKQVESGAATPVSADVAKWVKSVGGDPTKFGLADPAQVQIVRKAATQLIFNQAAALSTNPAYKDLELAKQANPSEGLDPQANLEIGSALLGKMQWQKQMFEDMDSWRQSHKGESMNDFPLVQWVNANPMPVYQGAARAQIGPLAGMPGNPGGAPSAASPGLDDLRARGLIK